MAAEKALEGKTGAIVAMDPHTGEILALASRPTFDPNQFSVRVSKSYWSEIINNPDHPLLNKAIQAQLAPGSTFKIIMSLAGLEEGRRPDHARQSATVARTFYGHFFACDKHHGTVDITTPSPSPATPSTTPWPNRLGIDTIAKYATSRRHLAEDRHRPPRRGLRHHALHRLEAQDPAREVVRRRSHLRRHRPGSRHRHPHPARPRPRRHRLRRRPPSPARRLPRRDHPPSQLQAIHENFPGSGDKTIPISPDNWQIITDAMAAVTATGTAAAAHLEGIDFAGKTGTAQVMSHGARATSLGEGHKTRPTPGSSAWPPAATPTSSSPSSGRHGDWGGNSAPLAAQVINAFVEKQRKRENNIRIADAPAPSAKPESPNTTPVPAKTPGAGVATTCTRLSSYRDFDWVLLGFVVLLSVI